MDFELNEEQLAFAEVAKQFADQMLAPHAAEWDENHHFPKDVLRQAGELGFLSIYTPPEHGGEEAGDEEEQRHPEPVDRIHQLVDQQVRVRPVVGHQPCPWDEGERGVEDGGAVEAAHHCDQIEALRLGVAGATPRRREEDYIGMQAWREGKEVAV